MAVVLFPLNHWLFSYELKIINAMVNIEAYKQIVPINDHLLLNI